MSLEDPRCERCATILFDDEYELCASCTLIEEGESDDFWDANESLDYFSV